MAATVKPMLAKAGELPVGDGWLYEIKWDGVRCTATIVDGEVTMQSRSSKTEWKVQFPAIARALAELPDCVIDGEIVTPDEAGNTFGLAAGAGSARAACFVVFDVLELGEVDCRPYPLEQRRGLAEAIVAGSGDTALQFSPSFDDGEALQAWVVDRGLEGIVAKRKGSRYIEGYRGELWLKVKVRQEQEFVVVGWTPGKNGRTGRIGGLVLAYYDGPNLVYAGRAGQDEKLDREFESRFQNVERSPLAETPKDAPRDVTWIAPEVVVQVAYQRWTEDERLLHPALKRVRDDKNPKDVGREP